MLAQGTKGERPEDPRKAVSERSPWRQVLRDPSEGAGQEHGSGSWIRAPQRSEVADRQLETDPGIKVTGMRAGNTHPQK